MSISTCMLPFVVLTVMALTIAFVIILSKAVKNLDTYVSYDYSAKKVAKLSVWPALKLTIIVMIVLSFTQLKLQPCHLKGAMIIRPTCECQILTNYKPN